MAGMNKFPAGRDEARVRSVLAHYEHQSEEEALLEDQLGLEDNASYTVMAIPNELVPEVQALIAAHGA